jgi:hypothetical protein
MCPVCLTTAILIAGSVLSTGGLAAVAILKLSVANVVEENPASTPDRIQSQAPTKEDRNG